MLEEYVGSIVMEVDGTDVDVVSVAPQRNTGRKPVKTMNRHRRVKGVASGIREYSLRVTAVVPKNKPINWDDIAGAKITLEDEGDGRETYLDCFTVQVGQQYDAENEARIDIEMIALDYVKE